MSRKKPPKSDKKSEPAPPSEVKDEDSASFIPENQNIESDAPAVARRSLESDNESTGGDVERQGE